VVLNAQQAPFKSIFQYVARSGKKHKRDPNHKKKLHIPRNTYSPNIHLFNRITTDSRKMTLKNMLMTTMNLRKMEMWIKTVTQQIITKKLQNSMEYEVVITIQTKGANESDNRVPCSNCGRKFAPDRVDVH
jgi:hypothetical protein